MRMSDRDIEFFTSLSKSKVATEYFERIVAELYDYRSADDQEEREINARVAKVLEENFLNKLKNLSGTETTKGNNKYE